MSPAAATGRRRGRRRSEAADDAILAATLELLPERGYRALAMAAVIERAGVSSATLYRRWTTKHDLVVAALATLVPDPVEVDTGSLAGDLDAFLRHYARALATSREDIGDALKTEMHTNPDLDRALRQKFFTPRLAQLTDILGRAVGRGELGEGLSPEAAISLMLGPLYYRGFVLRESLDEPFLAAAVAHAVAGLAGAHPGPRAKRPGGGGR